MIICTERKITEGYLNFCWKFENNFVGPSK